MALMQCSNYRASAPRGPTAHCATSGVLLCTELRGWGNESRNHKATSQHTSVSSRLTALHALLPLPVSGMGRRQTPLPDLRLAPEPRH